MWDRRRGAVGRHDTAVLQLTEIRIVGAGKMRRWRAEEGRRGSIRGVS